MLKYVGKGAFFLGVPARDLSDEEVKELIDDCQIESEKALLNSKLYIKGKEGDNERISV